MEEKSVSGPVKKKGRGTTIVLSIIIVLLAVVSVYLYNLLSKRKNRIFNIRRFSRFLKKRRIRCRVNSKTLWKNMSR